MDFKGTATDTKFIEKQINRIWDKAISQINTISGEDAEFYALMCGQLGTRFITMFLMHVPLEDRSKALTAILGDIAANVKKLSKRYDAAPTEKAETDEGPEIA